MQKPDFFIVDVPNCGTASLSSSPAEKLQLHLYASKGFSGCVCYGCFREGKPCDSYAFCVIGFSRVFSTRKLSRIRKGCLA